MQQPELEQYEDRFGRQPKRMSKTLSVSMFPGDHEMLDYIVERLGSNRSDATRTAIRAFYAVLKS